MVKNPDRFCLSGFVYVVNIFLSSNLGFKACACSAVIIMTETSIFSFRSFFSLIHIQRPLHYNANIIHVPAFIS